MRTRPKITSIEIIQYELTLQDVAPEPTIGIPVYKPGSVMQRRRYALRVRSDMGVTGAYSGGSAMDYAAIASFASCLLGRNPLQREDIYNGFKQAMRQQARMGVGVVDIASLCGSPAARSRGLRPVTPRQACPVAPALRPAKSTACVDRYHEGWPHCRIAAGLQGQENWATPWHPLPLAAGFRWT